MTVDVTCMNDAPEAVDDTASGTEDMPVTIDPADLVADDTDVDGDSLSISGVGSASGGSVALAGGTITFTPDADLCGAAGFEYDISDGNGGSDRVTWRSISAATTTHPRPSTTPARAPRTCRR